MKKGDDERSRAAASRLPGKDCGLCGFRTCAELAGVLLEDPEAIKRCVYLDEKLEHPGGLPQAPLEETVWNDSLGREFDFILCKFPEDPGPRETILPFNPSNLERLGIKKGDILYGRPAMVGCPVTHAGVVMEEPDYLSGLAVWCVVGPMAARRRGIEIGCYTPVAYEGIVKDSRSELQVGRRYFFLPRYCMIQSRHSGVISFVSRAKDGVRVRVEGIWIA